MNETQVQRNYKDSFFRMLFKDKENLLSLYNALNKTCYTDVNGLEITTLENAVYMNYKNDVSFVFDFELMLYEHQSTINPNMPLRDLLYVTGLLQKRIRTENLYGSKQIMIPSPRFVVFYNGTDNYPERQTLRLSDAYKKKQENPELELTVTVYNINYGYNDEILDACKTLKEYAMYVEQVRTYAKQMPLTEAIEKAVDYCIGADILSEFLRKNRAEVISMTIYEYDEEAHHKLLYEEGVEDGIERGIKLAESHLARVNQLYSILIDLGRLDDLKRATTDSAYQEQLIAELLPKEM
ncbi:MAG: hypothetical protein J1F42_09340 [Lachnospiraceae bacterium]|nr:hypothetical protein [Lachnospiraceae bacterium]